MIAGGSQHRDSHEDAALNGHEVFEALCALSLAGELSTEDQERLQGHLRHCRSCRGVLEELDGLTLDVLPIIAAEMHMERTKDASTDIPDPFAERRLLAAIGDRKRVVDHPSSDDKESVIRWWYIGTLAATFAVGIAIGAELMQGHSSREHGPAAPMQLAHNHDAPSLAKPEQVPHEDKSASLQPERRVHDLEVQIATARERLAEQSKNSDILKKQLADDQAQVEMLVRDKTSLSEQLSAAMEEASKLRQAGERDASVEAGRAIRLAQVEDEMKGLRAALNQKELALQSDAELLAHDRDIRDLIGARNVYMAEVYDIAETGKTNKPFGRVFYTKDRSLIFYGYDLDQQSNLKQSVAFQGWGTAGGGHQVNLGLFYQDESKNRWILKFNDAKMLAHVNSVFITVEPKGGSEKPTGKPLLTAYLRLEPNHP